MCRRKSYSAQIYLQSLGAYRPLGRTYRERYELCAGVNHTLQRYICKASGPAGPSALPIAFGMTYVPA